MTNYARHLVNPDQRTPIYGRDQVKNDAGGYVFKLDPFTALNRFLILGCDGGTYYTREAEMTRRAAAILDACIQADPARTVALIVRASEGLAVKMDSVIFALAWAAKGGPASGLALSKLNAVCRTATQLFLFIDNVQRFRGWGRSLRRAIANWYTSKSPAELLYQLTKYKQRGGWTHRDVLRLSHPRSVRLNSLLRFAIDGKVMPTGLPDSVYQKMVALQHLQASTTGGEAADFIRNYSFVREVVPTTWLNSLEVWEALLEKMPYTAMIRNLGKMSAVGLLGPLSDATKHVCNMLTDRDGLHRARIHPASVLLARTTYGAGRGVRGNLTWTPNPAVVDALDEAFHLSFDAVEPSGKNFLLAIDVSGSMGWRGYHHMGSIAGTHLKAYQAAATMALAQARIEPWSYTCAFSDGLREVANFGRHNRLNTALDELRQIPVGRTDCALPMMHATRNKLPVDVFVVYTDNETWFGGTHPVRALEEYRQVSGRDAKLVVCALTATNYTIADPNDAGMLDVVGFDPTCPAAITRFAKGF